MVVLVSAVAAHSEKEHMAVMSKYLLLLLELLCLACDMGIRVCSALTEGL